MTLEETTKRMLESLPKELDVMIPLVKKITELAWQAGYNEALIEVDKDLEKIGSRLQDILKKND